MFGTTKLATAAVTGVLSLAVTGAAAFAAFQPAAPTAVVAATDTGITVALHADRDEHGLRAILGRLVQNGTITQAQAEAILKAVQEASQQQKERHKERDEGAAVLKRVLAGMFKLSVEYIGLPEEAIKGQLKAGKSLGEIANTQPGKSREGLIRYLVTQLTAQIDRLVAEGKITRERADEMKAHLVEHVTRFVDHTYERKHRQERTPAERDAKKPSPSPSAKPTT